MRKPMLAATAANVVGVRTANQSRLEVKFALGGLNPQRAGGRARIQCSNIGFGSEAVAENRAGNLAGKPLSPGIIDVDARQFYLVLPFGHEQKSLGLVVGLHVLMKI
jgi:hypothetical protein